MKEQSLPKRMISSFAAGALVLTMCPAVVPGAAGTAYATESGDATAREETKAGTVNDFNLNNVAINMTVPVVINFGGQEGYDLANPQPSLTTNFKFDNSGLGTAQITNIAVTPEEAFTVPTNAADPSSTAAFVKSSVADGQTKYADANYKKYFSLYPSDDKAGGVKFDAEDTLDSAAMGELFMIPGGDGLECTYRLNLSNYGDSGEGNSVTVNQALLAEGAASANAQLAKVKYTIAPYVAAGDIDISSYTGDDPAAVQANIKTALDADPAYNSMYLVDTTDAGDMRAYSTDEIKKHAEDISKNGTASKYYGQYMGYINGTRTYICRSTWGQGEYAYPYDIRVIGILHDDKADGTGKAGLTFEFKNLLNPAAYMEDVKALEVDPDATTGLYKDKDALDGSGCSSRKSEIDGSYYWLSAYNAERYDVYGWGHNSSNSISGGWEDSLIRASLNASTDQAGTIASTMPSNLPLVSVNKTTTVDYAGTKKVTSDKVFLLSATEVYSGVTNWKVQNYKPTMLEVFEVLSADEGYQYEYYRKLNPDGNTANIRNPGHDKRYQLYVDGRDTITRNEPNSNPIWYRSLIPSDNNVKGFADICRGVYANSYAGHYTPSRPDGISPVFCF